MFGLNEIRKMNNVEKARKFIVAAFNKDANFREGYKANIAMCIYDNRRKDGRLNHNECNKVADKLIKLIFES